MRTNTERNQLRPYITRLVDTRSTATTRTARRRLVRWWLIHEYAPTWLDLAGLNENAEALRAVRTLDRQARSVAQTASTAAWRAQRPLGLTQSANLPDVAYAAIGASASLAARKASGPETNLDTNGSLAAGLASRAGDLAVHAVADAASWGATPDKHWESLHRTAVSDVLEPTVETLQTSAHQLFGEMINTGNGG